MTYKEIQETAAKISAMHDARQSDLDRSNAESAYMQGVLDALRALTGSGSEPWEIVQAIYDCRRERGA